MTTQLTYFDFDGSRGLECRLALALAGVDFVDDRVKRGDWAARKPTMPYGAMPVLTVDGQTLAQANAILVYVGRTYGLHPTDPWQAAQHEALMHSVEDVRAKVPPKAATDDETRAAREAFASGWLTTWATAVEGAVRGPFVAGDAPSVADLKLYVMLRALATGTYDHVPATFLDAFPKVSALHAAVDALPAVRGWFNRGA
jgi:glutathione S-transferase